MASRGDVVVAKRRVGFGAADLLQRFVVLQSDRANPHLPTVLVAPLEPLDQANSSDPTVVRVRADVVGATLDHVVVITLLSHKPWAAFQTGVVGSLDPRSLALVESVLRFLLELP